MKKCLLCLLCVCVFGTSAQAVLIDDFEDTSLAEYIKSVMLEQSGIHTLTFSSPAGALQVSKPAGDDNAEQVIFLRDDYSLDVGQVLRVDAAVAGISQYADFGIVVSADVDPEDVVWSGGTADGRHDYLYVYIKGGSSGWGCLGFDGTTQVPNSGYVTNQDLSVVTGLFIHRTADTVFEVGYSTDAGDTVFRTLTVASLSGSYNAIGFYGDVRNQVTYGDLDNLRIESLPRDPFVEQTQDQIAGAVDVTLNWLAAADPTGVYEVDPDIADQYVFLSGDDLESDPNLYYVGATGDPGTSDPNSSMTVQDLLNDNTYNWAVAEAFVGHTQSLTIGVSTLADVDPNNIIGPTWSFNTLPASPFVVSDPAENRLDAGDTATFKIEFNSATTPTVAWYKKGIDGDPNIPLNTSGDITITGPIFDDPNQFYYSVLEIANVEDADQGQYYCLLDNLAEDPPISSALALLVTQRTLADYKFLNNLNDDSGYGNNGTAHGDVSLPGYVEGVDSVANSAIEFINDETDPNQYVLFGTSAFPEAADFSTNGYGNGLDEGSIICWVKPAATGVVNRTVWLNYNDGATTGFGLSVNQGAGRLNIRGEQPAGGAYTEMGTVQGLPNRPGWDIFDGQWHMLGATWNAGADMAVYIDGQWVASVAANSPIEFLDWQRSMALGAGRSGTNRGVFVNHFSGSVDNLRIYNYRLTADDIASEYFDLTGVLPCTNMTFVGNAYNFDNTGSSYCKVDLADFAVFAANWLADGLWDAP